jgi:hypothetical protein
MTGGNFTLVGGFWGMIAAVQTPGAPWLNISRSNSAVVVFWRNTDPAWRLVVASHFAPDDTNAWTLIPPPYPTDPTNCVVTEPVSAGNRFYQLRKP